ncbi:hypothetical protein [Mangrovivirga cuniculi]|uniref:Outer membrane protein beta-barrel domain-containing protein n=1 Tax=Mangrovivirga cuniculi TaxID=2715131 RepID=A0A4D7KBH9_9BACT|nr:hypothetical protein [Mangrovivirga cuniculi]QCK16788.1 hypothetical protein DCC35_19650 [Mangrovivirga cuniculi]
MRALFFIPFFFIYTSLDAFELNTTISETILSSDTTDYGSLTKKEKRKWRIDNYTSDLFFNISLPHLNQFRIKPDGSGLSESGYFGFAFGFDYYYNKNRFINITGGTITNFILPIPIPIYAPTNDNEINSKYVYLTHNHKIKRNKLGYGIVYANYSLDPKDNYDSQPVSIYRSNALGIVGTYHLQLGRAFHMGLIYRPTFISLGNSESNYEHSLSLEFAWKIRMLK